MSKPPFRLLALVLGLCLAQPTTARSRTNEQRSFWSWGWGLYGLQTQSDPLDSARFDWSFLLFGNVDGTDEQTIARCNEILRLNPKHRFVLRVWPTNHLGDCPENGGQATLFHYLYQPGVKEKLLAETRRQIQFVLQHIDRPENVAGATFLEELPGHFTSAPFGADWENWRTGDRLPWDIKRFATSIEKALGEPFDLSKVRHRRWWGSKYAQVMAEIHAEMKRSLRGRPVLYYQHPVLRSLDAPSTTNRGKRPAADQELIPVHYKDIVNPNGADGFFGYPNNASTWEQRTQRPARALNCLVFSQISIPAGMRLTSLPEMTKLSRWNYRGNLGAFLFPAAGYRTKSSRDPEYQDASYWTSIDHIRRFAWDNKINPDIVERELAPAVSLDFDLADVGTDGLIRIHAQVWNRRHPSWYGGDVEHATLKALKATVRLTGALQLAVSDVGADTIVIGDLRANDGRAVEWTARIDSVRAGVPAQTSVEVVASAADGSSGQASSTAVDQRVPARQTHMIGRAGDRWIEPGYRLPGYAAAVELQPLVADIVSPALELADGTHGALYRGTLRSGTRLVIGPGAQATIYPVSLFSAETRRFFPNQPAADGAVEFSHGYSIFSAAGAVVHAGERYRLVVNGWARDGGNNLVIARFNGTEDGKPSFRDIPVLANALSDQPRTIESGDFEVPDFGDGSAKIVLYFYRRDDKGSIHYSWFDCIRVDMAERGIDVSANLEGTLADLVSPLTVWRYSDRSEPDLWGRPKLSVRFLSPQEAQNEGERYRHPRKMVRSSKP